VLLACFSLTVVFDMVIAVSAGLVLASILFIRRISMLTGTELVNLKEHEHLGDLPEQVAVYDINGALFFGAAEKAISALHHANSNVEIVVLDMSDVPMIDMTGIVALESLLNNLHQQKIAVLIVNLLPRMREKLLRAGIMEQSGELEFCSGLPQVRERALSLLNQSAQSVT
jgi:SulP family sulfate permease